VCSYCTASQLVLLEGLEGLDVEGLDGPASDTLVLQAWRSACPRLRLLWHESQPVDQWAGVVIGVDGADAGRVVEIQLGTKNVNSTLDGVLPVEPDWLTAEVSLGGAVQVDPRLTQPGYSRVKRAGFRRLQLRCDEPLQPWPSISTCAATSGVQPADQRAAGAGVAERADECGPERQPTDERAGRAGAPHRAHHVDPQY